MGEGKPEETKTQCPIMRTAAMLAHESRDESCIGEKCEWWQESSGCRSGTTYAFKGCAINYLAFLMEMI